MASKQEFRLSSVDQSKLHHVCVVFVRRFMASTQESRLSALDPSRLCCAHVGALIYIYVCMYVCMYVCYNTV